MDSNELLWTLGGLALAVVIGIGMMQWSQQRDRKRHQEIRQAVMRMGLMPRDQGTAPDLAPFALSRLGDRGAVSWPGVSFAVDGGQVTICEYIAVRQVERRDLENYRSEDRFYRQNRSEDRFYRQTVLLFKAEYLRAPAFYLRPAGIGDKIKQLFHQTAIDFPHHPDFAQAYLLRGNDESQIRQFFTDQKLNMLTRYRGWYVEGNGQRLICYRLGELAAGATAHQFVQEALAIARGLSQW